MRRRKWLSMATSAAVTTSSAWALRPTMVGSPAASSIASRASSSASARAARSTLATGREDVMDDAGALVEERVVEAGRVALDRERPVESGSLRPAEQVERRQMAGAETLAVRVRQVELEQPVAGEFDRRERIGLFDVHVEEVGDHADAVDADVGRERAGLLDAVQEERLVAVERLDREPHTAFACVHVHLAGRLDRELPLLRIARERAHPALGGRHDAERGRAEPREQVDAALVERDRLPPECLVWMREVARRLAGVVAGRSGDAEAGVGEEPLQLLEVR